MQKLFTATLCCSVLLIISCSPAHKGRIVHVTHGQGLELSSKQIHDLTLKSEKGDGEAAFRLFLYFDILLRDHKNGDYWLQKAAENGNSSAQYNIGVTYLHTPYKNIEKAYYWIKKSAEQGDVNAKIYYQRFLSKEDVQMLTNKANTGDANAAYKLYEFFYYIEDNDQQTQYWLKKAADNGNPDAKKLIKLPNYK